LDYFLKIASGALETRIHTVIVSLGTIAVETSKMNSISLDFNSIEYQPP